MSEGRTVSQFDVAVVGLGAVGSSALFALAGTGARVIGIDRFNPPHAFGSSLVRATSARGKLHERHFRFPGNSGLVSDFSPMSALCQ
jgi:glycine/D-amino acid oxidase-like deaminating enzyme